MKKIMIAVLAGVMVFGLIGCSQAPKSDAVETAAQAEEQPEARGTESADQADTADEVESADGEAMASESGSSIFGKVKSIVGNEIELELAEPPFDVGDDEGNGIAAAGGGSASMETETFVFNGETEAGVPADGDTDAQSADDTQVIIATTDGSGEMHVIGGENGEKMELEYTGESKSIMIPAGTSIMSLLSGNGTMDDIKKGSVLMVTVEDDTVDTLKATDILVME